MKPTCRPAAHLAIFLISICGARASARGIAVDLSAYKADCGVTVEKDDQGLTVAWPMDGGETGRLGVDLRAGEPLFRSLDVSPAPGAPFRSLLEKAEPEAFLVVGER